jgi:thymidine kinase
MCKIEIIIGPMFSGKSTELLRRTSRLEAIGKNILYINHMYDTRTDDYIQTHSNTKKFAKKLHNLYDINDDELNSADVLAIDEAQFFDDGLPEVCNQLANQGIRVIIAGLDMDYMGRPFGPMPHLLAIAEFVTKVHAICVQTGNLANYSYRHVPGDSVVQLGEKESYVPLSRMAYTQDMRQRKQEDKEENT